MKTSILQVNEYFKCHLQGSAWQKLTEATKNAAVSMAETDIMLALNSSELDEGDLLIFCAVCEQALYLALEYNDPASNQEHGALKSETVEGLGKREYFEKASADSARCGLNLSPRCELFLSRLPGYGAVRLARG